MACLGIFGMMGLILVECVDHTYGNSVGLQIAVQLDALMVVYCTITFGATMLTLAFFLQ